MPAFSQSSSDIANETYQRYVAYVLTHLQAHHNIFLERLCKALQLLLSNVGFRGSKREIKMPYLPCFDASRLLQSYWVFVSPKGSDYIKEPDSNV